MGPNKMRVRNQHDRSGRSFNRDFKGELCREVITTGKTIKDVATAYGVGPVILRN